MSDKSPSDQPDLPALSNDELRETLDLMATAVASMSNRIDGLTKVANKQIEVSTEARIAAFAARDQTNPEKYGELIGQTVDGGIADSLKRLNKAAGFCSTAQKDQTHRFRKPRHNTQTRCGSFRNCVKYSRATGAGFHG